MSNHQVPLPFVTLSGFDAGLSEEEQGVQQGMHRFAREVMRPLGQAIDRMPADQAYLPGSPFWHDEAGHGPGRHDGHAAGPGSAHGRHRARRVGLG